LIVDQVNNEVEIRLALKYKKGDLKESIIFALSRLEGVKKVVW
jgi:hypothetical protein